MLFFVLCGAAIGLAASLIVMPILVARRQRERLEHIRCGCRCRECQRLLSVYCR